MKRGALENHDGEKMLKPALENDEAVNIYDLNLIDLEEEEIQMLIEQQSEGRQLSESSIKKLLNSFVSVLENNTRERIKYNDQPEKFLDSEIALDSCLKQLQDVSTVPRYFSLFDRLLPTLLSVLAHENADIAIDVVCLCRDFLSSVDDDDEKSFVYVSSFAKNILDNGVVELMADLIRRLDVSISEEKQGVYDILEFFENLLEINMEETCSLITSTQMISWILNYLKTSEFDDIKLYTSEIACILVQNSSEIQKKIGALNGIEILLNLLAKYRTCDPTCAEEEEMIENIFDVISVVSVHQENREKFFAAEGLQLVKVFIRAKKYCRIGSIKFLNFFLTNHAESIIKWVDIGGLGTLFKALMNSDLHAKKYKSISRSIEEEQLISILFNLASLVFNNKDQYQDYAKRICLKFKEKSYEKLKKLLEIKTRLQSKVDSEDHLARNDELDFKRFTLQLADSIVDSLEKHDDDFRQIISAANRIY